MLQALYFTCLCKTRLGAAGSMRCIHLHGPPEQVLPCHGGTCLLQPPLTSLPGVQMLR